MTQEEREERKKSIAEDAQNSLEANEAKRLQSHQTNITVRDQRISQHEENYRNDLEKAQTFDDQENVTQEKDKNILKENVEFQQRAEGINKQHDQTADGIRQGQTDATKAINEEQPKSKVQQQVDQQKVDEPTQQNNNENTVGQNNNNDDGQKK